MPSGINEFHEEDFSCLIESDGSVYAGSTNSYFGGRVYEYDVTGDSEAWTSRSGPGFGDDRNTAVSTLVDSSGTIYAGTENREQGCQVWRYNSPGDWIQVNIDGFDDRSNSRASSMAVYEGYLYVGTRNEAGGCEVWRYDDPAPGDWTKVSDVGFDDPYNIDASSMAVHEGSLYVGTLSTRGKGIGGVETMGKIYEWDGSSWSPATASSTLDGRTGVTSILADPAHTCLYAGTTKKTSSAASSVGGQIYCSSNPSPDDWEALVDTESAIISTENAGSDWNYQVSGTTSELEDVSATGQGNAWAVGRREMQTDDPADWAWTILKFDGLTWAKDEGPSIAIDSPPENLHGVTVVGEDVWAVGAGGTILHYDGSDWYNQSNPDLTTNNIYSVSATSSSDVWAVGERGLILHYGEAGWEDQSEPGLTSLDLHDVTTAGVNGSSCAWAVGDHGTVVHTSDGGESWEHQAGGTTSHLRGVHAIDASRVLAVGESGSTLAEMDLNVTQVSSLLLHEDKLFAGTRKYGDGGIVLTGADIYMLDLDDPGGEWTDTTGELPAGGFGDTDNIVASSSAHYGDKLYIGTRNSDEGCEVWSYHRPDTDPPSEPVWTQVNSGGFGSSSNKEASAMEVYLNKLFVGTYNEGGCELWSSDGGSWSQVGSTGLLDQDNISILDMAVYDSGNGAKLYLAAENSDGVKLYSYDGNSFEDVTPEIGTGNEAILSLVAYDGKLYIGTENDGGCEVWSYDGSGPEQVQDGIEEGNIAATSLSVYQVYEESAGEWDELLFIGTRHEDGGARLYSYDVLAGLTDLSNLPFEDSSTGPVTSLSTFGGRLYVGQDGGKIYSYDGESLAISNRDGFLDFTNTGISTLAAFGSNLYAGTENNDGCEIWSPLTYAPYIDPNEVDRDYGIVGEAVFPPLEINGRNFLGQYGDAPNPTVYLRKPGSDPVDGSSIQVTDTGEKIYVTFSEGEMTTEPGSYDLVVEAPDGQRGELPGGFYVIEDVEPVISSVGHTSGSEDPFWNDRVAAVEIAGSNFQPGATAYIEGSPSIPGQHLVVDSEHQVHCLFDLRGAVAGSWTLVVTNKNGKPAIYTFTIWDSPPQISSVSPSEVDNLGGALLTIVGQNFQDGATVELQKDGETPITADGVTVKNNGQTMTCAAYVDGASPGSWDIEVTNPDGQKDILGGKLTINQYVVSPSVISISPDSATNDGRVDVTITGDEFDDGATTYLKRIGLEDIKGEDIAVNSSSEITCSFNLENTAPGKWDVVVENGTGRSGTLDEGFDILEIRGIRYPPISPEGATTWYLAEGSTGGPFETWVLVMNPGDSPATASLTFLTPEGKVEGPDVALEAGTRQTVEVKKYVNHYSVSTLVESDQPVIAERAVYWNEREGGHDSIGITEPANDWYLAEGSTGGPFETWVLVMNPGDETATAALTFLTPQGEVRGPDVTLEPGTRETIEVKKYVTDYSVSTLVASDQPVIAERAVYWNDRTGGHDSIGITEPSLSWYLAEGSTGGPFETWVLVMNPGDSRATASLTFLTPQGEVRGPDVTLEPGTRETVEVKEYVTDYSVSTLVESDQPVIAERAVYWNGREGGHDSIGITEPANDWYLAEGSTDGPFETWVLVMNPGDETATASLTFLTPQGEVRGPDVTLEPGTRETVEVKKYVTDYSASTLVESDKPVIAERAVYWNARIGGHDSIGHSVD